MLHNLDPKYLICRNVSDDFMHQQNRRKNKLSHQLGRGARSALWVLVAVPLLLAVGYEKE